MYYIVYCLVHPYHENSDAWILDVYQDENKATEIVEKLNTAFGLYQTRVSHLLMNANSEYHKTQSDDVFKTYRNEKNLTDDEMTFLTSIHPKALDKYSYYDEQLEYRWEKITKSQK